MALRKKFHGFCGGFFVPQIFSVLYLRSKFLTAKQKNYDRREEIVVIVGDEVYGKENHRII